MSFLKKIVFTLCLTIIGNTIFSQEKIPADTTIFEEFNYFFNKEIKYQGVKGDWIFGLNEITAYRKFDYNNDGFNDLLIEFNAAPIDEGNYTNYYAVLFKNNSNQKYEYVNYIESVDMIFMEFNEELFVFQKNSNSQIIKFSIANSKFESIQ